MLETKKNVCVYTIYGIKDTIYHFLMTYLLLDTINFTRSGICLSEDAPGTKRVAGTNTFFLIDYQDIPSDKRKRICHTMMVCEVRPEKVDPNHTQITIGGNRTCYPGDVGTNTTLLELVKLLVNSVLSWKGAHFSSINLNTST